MKKRLFSTTPALLASMLLLASCGGSNDNTTSTTGTTDSTGSTGTTTTEETGTTTPDTTITFSWWGSDSRHEALQNVAAVYEEKTGVKVEVVYVAWSGCDQKMLTMLAGQEEADVMQLNYNWLHSFGRGQNVFYTHTHTQTNKQTKHTNTKTEHTRTSRSGQVRSDAQAHQHMQGRHKQPQGNRLRCTIAPLIRLSSPPPRGRQ